MHLSALIFLVVVAALVMFGLKPKLSQWPVVFVATFLLVWLTLILAGHILSVALALGSTPAYILACTAIAALIGLGLRLVPFDWTGSSPGAKIIFPFNRNFSWLCGAFLAASAFLVLAGNLVLMWGMLPSNPDSIVYRFARAYWYVGHGSLKHFTNHSDPRALYYPFNSTLAYIPLIHFQLGPRSFSALSLFSWLMVAQTTYLFARDLGGSRLCAFATAWLICLTPNVLLQALSTNDEIIAAAPLLAGLYFLRRWYQSRQDLDALLAAIGIGISLGSKLHVIFYWPLLLAAALYALWNYQEVIHEVARWLNARRLSILVIIIAAGALLSSSFMVYNYLSTGRISAWEFNAQIINAPFNWNAAFQTLILYLAQIILTPIADLHIAVDLGQRAQHYDAFNRVFAPLFTWIDNGPAFMSASYRFAGINTTSAVSFNEHTIFIGFTWLIALIAGLILFNQPKRDRSVWAQFQFLSLPIWFLTFSVSTRYIEGFSVYLGYATIVASPVFVYAFAPVKLVWLDHIRWVALALVALAHVFFALSIFMTSSPRNMINFAKSDLWPVSRGFQVDYSVLEETSKATNGLFSHTIAWGQPHWVFMAYHPQIRQYLASAHAIAAASDERSDHVSVALRHSRYDVMPVDQGQFHVYSFPQLTAYGHSIPIRIPDKSSPGLTWIGNLTFALGPEWVFAAGNGVDRRHAGYDRFIVIKYNELSNFGHEPDPAIRVLSTIYGLGPEDDLSFRFELRIDGAIAESSEWNQLPEVQFKAAGMTSGNTVLSVFVRNNSADNAVYRVDAPLRSTKPLPLIPNHAMPSK